MPTDIHDIEQRLWAIADNLRANSKLKAADYSTPVLGLIFLRYADHRFAEAEKELEKAATGRREMGKLDYQAKGVLFVPDEARFRSLLELPEGENLGQALNEAMKSIEDENEDLRGVLPKTYNKLENATLVELMKLMSSIPTDIEGDAFGKIYEYFLGHFAMAEGSKAGEFYTPTSIVRLIVEIIEPYHGRIYDPACGSGGMFVQSARFVENHQGRPSEEISVWGQERVEETVRLCKMNLSVHGLAGDIRQANTYYEDLHDSVGRFDFVIANPPFNVNRVDKERLRDDPRLPFGLPSTDNANYIWIQQFYSALSDEGRAGFVMANSAADASHSELEIRKKLIQEGVVDVVVAVASKFFYTVSLPVTLWFFDKRKKGTERENQILFIDARKIYRQIDRAHRDFKPEQIEFLANIVRLYRGQELEEQIGGNELLEEAFPAGEYMDVPGLCATKTRINLKQHGWSLNPSRYVGVREEREEDFDYLEHIGQLYEELEALYREAAGLHQKVSDDLGLILDSSVDGLE